MEPHFILYFLTLYESNSFTVSAKKCYVSQPALSKSIKQLEERMGGELFYRTTKGVKPTEFGHLIYPIMKELSDSSQKLYDFSKDFLNLKSIPMHIGVTQSIGSKKFIPILTQLKNKSPLLEFEVVVDSEKNLLNRLENIDLDIIILPKDQYITHEPDIFDENLLYIENFHVAFHKSHRFKSFSKISLKDCENEVNIMRLNCEIIDYIKQYCIENNINIYPEYRCESDKWVIDLIAENVGISIFPENCISHPDVRSLPISDLNKSREIITLTLNSQKNTPKLKLFHQTTQYLLTCKKLKLTNC